MNIGTEWLVDAEGCSAELLRDVDAVRNVCDEVLADLGLRVVGEPMWQLPLHRDYRWMIDSSV